MTALVYGVLRQLGLYLLVLGIVAAVVASVWLLGQVAFLVAGGPGAAAAAVMVAIVVVICLAVRR